MPLEWNRLTKQIANSVTRRTNSMRTARSERNNRPNRNSSTRNTQAATTTRNQIQQSSSSATRSRPSSIENNYVHTADENTTPAFSNVYFQKITNKMDSIMKSCQKIMNLNNSPPYILDILPDIHIHIRLIITQKRQKFDELNEIDYFQTFIANLMEKCKYMQKILRNKNLMEINSATRRDLTRMSLIFSHMLNELKAIFPDGKYIDGRYRITKPDAALFWERTFGPQMIVPWHSFKRELNRSHPLGDSIEDETALKNTINLTQNEYISKFEFDIFTRLFQPWDQLLVNWKLLAVTHPGYASFMTYDEVKQTLGPFRNKPGSYLFRLSCTRLGQWAIGYVTDSGEILQTIPQNKSLMKVLIDGDNNRFYSFPKGELNNPDLNKYLDEKNPAAIEVNDEEYQIYCEMGSSFQLCKICIENEKDTQIEPCMHLICSDCLQQWQNKDQSQTPTCPFCRCDIRGFEKIKISKRKKQPEVEETLPQVIEPEVTKPEVISETKNETEIDQSEAETEPERLSPTGAVNLAFENEPTPEPPIRNQPTVPQRTTSSVRYDPFSPPPIPPRINQLQ